MCSRHGTLKHILSSCKTALTEGRYRWRHDEILKDIAKIVSTAISNNTLNLDKRAIGFHRAGEKPKKKNKNIANILSPATDWELRVDLGKRLKFPDHIVQTSLRPDLIFFSNNIKKLIMWELTVPWEEHAEEAHERKMLKYDELKTSCKNNGWKSSCLPIEVGVRGFAARSLCKALIDIGLAGANKRKAIRTITNTAKRTAKWLWIKRDSSWATK